MGERIKSVPYAPAFRLVWRFPTSGPKYIPAAGLKPGRRDATLIGLRQVAEWVPWNAVDPHLKVEVDAGATAGAADDAEGLPLRNLLPH